MRRLEQTPTGGGKFATRHSRTVRTAFSTLSWEIGEWAIVMRGVPKGFANSDLFM